MVRGGASTSVASTHQPPPPHPPLPASLRCLLSGDLQQEEAPFDVSDIEELPIDVAHDAVAEGLICGDERTCRQYTTDIEAAFEDRRDDIRRHQRDVIDRIAEDGLRGRYSDGSTCHGTLPPSGLYARCWGHRCTDRRVLRETLSRGTADRGRTRRCADCSMIPAFDSCAGRRNDESYIFATGSGTGIGGCHETGVSGVRTIEGGGR